MRVYIIEMRFDEQWNPTVGAALNSKDARAELKRWRKRNPDDEFRITIYYRKEN